MSNIREQAAHGRRRRILDLAGEMFLEQGYEAVSTADLIRRVGGSKATLYSYFPSKAALFLAVVADQVETLVSKASDPDDQEGDLRETLRRLGLQMLTIRLSPRIIGLHRIGVAELYRHPEISKELEKLGRHFAQPVVAFFRQLGNQGKLSISDAELATDQFRELCGARHFNAVLFGLTPTPGPDEVTAAVDEAVDLFLRGYAPEVGQGL